MPGAVTTCRMSRTRAGATSMPTLATAAAEGNSIRAGPEAEEAETLAPGRSAAGCCFCWSPAPEEGHSRQLLYRPHRARATSAARVSRVGRPAAAREARLRIQWGMAV